VMLTAGGDRPAITAFTDAGPDQLDRFDAPTCGTAADAPDLLTRNLPELTSWAALPLRTNDTELGVLAIAGCTAADPLTDLLEVAAALVSQGMTAYDRAVLFEQVQELAVVDDLTQLANRRRFFEVATRDLEAATRQGRAVVAMMLDIDHFKQINDTYGHPTGDRVIQLVAARLAAELSSTDVIGRYGGEEFAVLAQDTDPQLAERLRAGIADLPVETSGGRLAVTISVGVAGSRPGEDLVSLLARADQALYRAKQGGRDRVVATD